MHLRHLFLMATLLSGIFEVEAAREKPEQFSESVTLIHLPGIGEASGPSLERMGPFLSGISPHLLKNFIWTGFDRHQNSWFDLPGEAEIPSLFDYVAGTSSDRPSLFQRMDVAAAEVGQRIADFITERSLNPEKVIISGHSQGAMLAPFVASWLAEEGRIYTGGRFQLGGILTIDAPLIFDRAHYGPLPVSQILSYMGTQDGTFVYLARLGNGRWIEGAKAMLPILGGVTVTPLPSASSSGVEKFTLTKDGQETPWTLVTDDTNHSGLPVSSVPLQKELEKGLEMIQGGGSASSSSSSAVVVLQGFEERQFHHAGHQPGLRVTHAEGIEPGDIITIGGQERVVVEKGVDILYLDGPQPVPNGLFIVRPLAQVGRRSALPVRWTDGGWNRGFSRAGQARFFVPNTSENIKFFRDNIGSDLHFGAGITSRKLTSITEDGRFLYVDFSSEPLTSEEVSQVKDIGISTSGIAIQYGGGMYI